ncbi:MAG TPA: FtsX-like permease family protein, partial [Nocardioides sp.]
LDRLASLPPYSPERGPQLPYRPAPLIVDRSTFDAIDPAEWLVRLDNRLDVPPDWSSDDLATAVASAEAMKTTSASDQTGSLTSVSINDLSAIAREVHGQQQTARSSIAPAVLSLVLVALALLLRLLMAASEARVPELALASLRGLPSRQMWRLGLSEPLAVIAAALPVGAVIGPVLALVLVRWWLVPGLPLPFPAASLWAAALVVVAAVAVAAFAVGLVLRTTLSGLLAGVRRPTASGRLALVGQLLLAAVVLSVLASKLTGGRGGQPDATDLVLPVLLAVFAGLVATKLIGSVATWWTRQRRTTRSLAGFVAARAISRRREGTLVILPIAAAIAVCVFGAGVYASAAEWRASVAATRAPAAEVYTSQLNMGQTIGVSRELDPDGKWLMAVTTLQTTGPQYVVLDASRLANVASWPGQWTQGRSLEEIQQTLVPPGQVPVVTGTRIGLRMSQDAAPGLTAEIRLVTSRGDIRAIYVGPFGADESTISVAAPFCASGCRLEGLSIGGRSAEPIAMRGTLTVAGIVVDGQEDAAAISEAQWVESPTATSASSVSSTELRGSSLVVDVDSEGQQGVAQLGAGGIPALPPVVRGYDADVVPPEGAFTGAFGMNVDPRITSESLPLLGPAGVLIDYSTLTTDRIVPTQDNTTYMFANADTPESVRQELVGRGMVPTYSLVDEKRTLDQSAYALALRLYAVIAVLVLVMALAGLVVSTAVQLPVRRRDAAALRVVGVRRGTVMSAVAREFAVVLGGAGLAGIAAGSLAQYVVLRTITLGYVENLSTPRLVSSIDWSQVAIWTVAASVVLGVAAFVSASLTVRGARGSTLRETAR